MAFKSPGIYFQEVDNTEYSNPAAEVGTTVAIIGFAKKGPIGEPVECASYNDFKAVFGDPIPGTYAGLGVRSVLAAGGAVLYVRIADESLATKSNVILKNGSAAVEGALAINNKDAITVGSVINGNVFKNGFVYASKFVDSIDDTKSKKVFIRTPASGRMTVADMLQQLDAGLKDEYGYKEYKFKVPSYDGWKMFSTYSKNTNDDDIYGYNQSVGKNGTTILREYPKYFVKLPAGASGKYVAEIINNALDKGTNPYQILKFNNEFLFNDLPLSKEDGSEANTLAYLDISANVNVENSYKIAVKKASSEEPLQIKVPITKDGTKIYLSQLADDIDAAFETNNVGIRCKYVFDKTAPNSVGTPALLFFSTDYDNFTILPVAIDAKSGDKVVKSFEKSLFTPIINGSNSSVDGLQAYKDFVNMKSKVDGKYDDEWESIISNRNSENSNWVPSKTGFNFWLEPLPPREQSMVDEEDKTVIVEYLSSTNSLVFRPNPDIVKEIEGSNVEVLNPVFNGAVDSSKSTGLSDADGRYNFSYLFEVNNPFENGETSEEQSWADDYYSVETDNKRSVGYMVRNYVGELGLKSVSALRGSDGRIFIQEENSTEPPMIEDIEGETTLLDLFGPYTTESEFEAAKFKVGRDAVLLKIDGKFEVKEENEDMIVFTAKEYGSGTSDIAIEIFTSVSPIDESKTHYINLYVNGILKESWDEVSYDPNSKDYFVNLINDDPDNGGSAYVEVEVKRGNDISGDVTVPDTSTLSSNGIVYLGKPIKAKSVNYDGSVANTITDYTLYDYRLGNDGMPTGDPTDLFLNAMNTETSGLANKDLYSWHILITPDDGQREEIQNVAVELCEFMEEAIYIADPPSGLSRDMVIKWHNGGSTGRTTALQSNYVCTYWPWLKVYNTIESRYQYVMPSIVMAAQFCKVDNSYAPWYAPAGETNGYCSTALDLEVNSKDKRYPNKIDRDHLYLDQNRINPFLKLRNGNILAYGEKTCQRKNSTLTKIHTRRMLIALKKDLNAVIKGFIFQPTMGENISKIKSNVTAVMEKYKTGGGIDSYNVNTDMNTIETLQQDLLYIAISCVPLGCIEQVEITFTLNRSAE